MKRLTRSAYAQAVAYIRQTARPLEQARFAFHFENGAAAEVLAALSAFQNNDGGFGHGLEPDIRLADSSVIATTLAFQLFRECAVARDHPLVVRACQYLVSTYDADHVNWPIVPDHVDSAPHAPWWVAGGDLDKSLANPRAEIAGYLNDYPEHFPAALREQVTASVIAYLSAQPGDMEMHDLFCYLRFWISENLPQMTRDRVLIKLTRIVDATVKRRRADWAGYGLNPLAVASKPDSPFAERLRAAIEENLDFVIETQADSGGWMPNWSWGDRWPDAWEQARDEWSGVLTLANLRTLHAFGRIDM
jgi:hypothetical protein